MQRNAATAGGDKERYALLKSNRRRRIKRDELRITRGDGRIRKDEPRIARHAARIG
jgi:hypothetical protein